MFSFLSLSGAFGNFLEFYVRARSSLIFLFMALYFFLCYCFRDVCETRGGLAFSFIILLAQCFTLPGGAVSYHTVLHGNRSGTSSCLTPD